MLNLIRKYEPFPASTFKLQKTSHAPRFDQIITLILVHLLLSDSLLLLVGVSNKYFVHISVTLQDRRSAMDLQTRFPEVFTQTNIDRHGCQRNVEMKIIAIGMMRTGTMCKKPPKSY